MPASSPAAGPERVLVLAPVGRDARLAQRVLATAGLAAEVCPHVGSLCDEIERGAGAALLTEEALSAPAWRSIQATLERQPAWSDLPLVVCTDAGAITNASRGRLGGIVARGNVTLIERPAHTRTLVSALRAALHARGRQYELRDMFDQRERLLQAAEAANRLKDEFLATMSHELRTPLNAMLGWAQMLRSGVLPEGRRAHALETIERNARAQAQLVEDLLDVSRIVSGKLRLEVAPVLPSQFVEAAIDSVRLAADAKGVLLESDLAANAGLVLGDAARLQQVVWNLLANAVKFTDRGGLVRVVLRRDGPHARLTVTDTGRGIAAHFLPFLFERFRQADGSSTRAQGGLGLGLAIVKHLVELHGGVIHAASEGEGRGAEFHVLLPVYGDSQAPSSSSEARSRDGARFDCPPELADRHVLVVDDEPDARDLLAMALETCQARVTTASSAAEALEALVRVRPDVLVSDIGMPGADGYSLIRQVRALPPEQGGRTPAVALTAYARTEDRVRARRAGFDDHMAKPVEPREIVAVIAALLR